MYAIDAIDNRHLFSDFDDHLNGVVDASITGPAVEFLPVEGLRYAAEFITAEEERRLLDAVDHCPWNEIWQRRTQFYGFSYDDWDRAMDDNRMRLPTWAEPFGARLVDRRLFGAVPNQMGVNEYLPGQGIAPHVDRHGGPVASLSLGSGCVMDLVSLFDKPTISFWLAPRSVIVITGEARSAWKHGIARRQKDIVDGVVYRRRRRVSLTFRHITKEE